MLSMALAFDGKLQIKAFKSHEQILSHKGL